MGDFGEGHLIKAILLGESFLANQHFVEVSGLVALLFALLTHVFLVKTALVLDVHVDRIVHHPLAVPE